MTGIKVTGVTYRYAGTSRVALDDVSLDVPPGRVTGVVGANESGKSTLCLVVSALAPASIGGKLEGSVVIDGVDTRNLKPHEAPQKCGVLFQNPATQLSGTGQTVWEEIAFGPRNLGLTVHDIVERVAWALAIARIEPLAPRDPNLLSGGQAQLVALASVLALRPAYLVLDEPTSQLDPFGTHLVGQALVELARGTGTGILVVEHKTDLLARMADEVVALDGGQIVLRGPAQDVLSDPHLTSIGVEPPSAVRIHQALDAAGWDGDPGDAEAIAAAFHDAGPEVTLAGTARP